MDSLWRNATYDSVIFTRPLYYFSMQWIVDVELVFS